MGRSHFCRRLQRRWTEHLPEGGSSFHSLQEKKNKPYIKARRPARASRGTKLEFPFRCGTQSGHFSFFHIRVKHLWKGETVCINAGFQPLSIKTVFSNMVFNIFFKVFLIIWTEYKKKQREENGNYQYGYPLTCSFVPHYLVCNRCWKEVFGGDGPSALWLFSSFFCPLKQFFLSAVCPSEVIVFCAFFYLTYWLNWKTKS